MVYARCLLGVEKVGRSWGKGWREEEICGFGGDNMKEYITKLARE